LKVLDWLESQLNGWINALRGKSSTLAPINNWETKIVHWVLAIVSLIFLYKFYLVAFSRINYPFDLEWMEGGAVDHVLRVMRGQRLYVEPDADFVPYIYTPFSYYLGAAFSFVFGKGYLALRLLSIISISGCFVMLFKLTKKLTQNRVLGLLSMGLFASTYVISNNWFDIGRVDSIFLSLVLMAIYRLWNAKTSKDLVICAAYLFFAYFTKQSALILYPFFALVVFNRNIKKGVFFSAILFGTTVVVMKLMNLYSGGWFMYYTMTVGQGHELLGKMIKDFWTEDLLGRFKWPVYIAIGFIGTLCLNPLNKKHFFLILISAGMLGMSYFGRLHSGGDVNVLMPVFSIISLACVLGIDALSKHYKNIPLVGLTVIIGGFLLVQLLEMRYDTDKYTPTTQDITAGEQILTYIESVDGPVMLSSHGYWQEKVNKLTISG